MRVIDLIRIIERNHTISYYDNMAEEWVSIKGKDLLFMSIEDVMSRLEKGDMRVVYTYPSSKETTL